VADADSFGLKLRHLLLPIDEHPLGAFRAVASRASAAAFPGENENTTAHLGLLGALGLLSLLGLAVARTAGAMPLGDDDLDAPAALTVVTLLVAQVGGLGSIFNLLVAPDVRAYNRMSTFIAWFALLATAALVTRALGRIGGEGRVGGASVVGALVLLALGVADQVPMASLRSIRGASAPDFAEVETFVERVEGLLPRGAMVFQLPHGTLPVDTPRPPLGLYDSGRPYLSSKTLRWSFGSIVGRTDHWYRDTVRLAPAEMAQRLALAGFAGIWIDRAAYRGANHPRADLYVRLAEVAGVRPESSSGGRYCFISLEGVRHRLQLERGEQGAEEASGASAP
jgi:phosphoglycerol transferase